MGFVRVVTDESLVEEQIGAKPQKLIDEKDID
jgi:hypothetical protein